MVLTRNEKESVLLVEDETRGWTFPLRPIKYVSDGVVIGALGRFLKHPISILNLVDFRSREDSSRIYYYLCELESEEFPEVTISKRKYEWIDLATAQEVLSEALDRHMLAKAVILRFREG